MIDISELTNKLREQAAQSSRYMVAIAAPPGSGKTTLAEQLRQALVTSGESAVVAPMDGFHFDDIVLNARGTAHVKVRLILLMRWALKFYSNASRRGSLILPSLCLTAAWNFRALPLILFLNKQNSF